MLIQRGERANEKEATEDTRERERMIGYQLMYSTNMY